MWKKKIVINSLNWSLAISSFIGALLSFIVGKDYLWIGLIVFISAFFMSFVAIYCYLRFKKHHKISSRGSVSIEAMYGNILEIRKSKKNISKPVIVIPVNSSFDTIVEDDPSIVDRIVEGTSIHGQWLKMYGKDKKSLKRIDDDIDKYISEKGMVPVKTLTKKRGKKKVYKLGSHVFVERDDCSFLLFALTEFDEHNKVIKGDAESFVDLMNKLMNITDDCAGKHIYIPVMGTKIALFGINELSSFEYIKNAALNKKNSLRASITIVIYEKNRDRVSIYD